MRKRRSPLHNHIHASNIKKRPYDNAPPPHHTLGSHTSSGTYLPLQLYHRRLANKRPVQPVFTFLMQVFCSTIQGLLHASLLLQQWKPTYPRNIFRHSFPALLEPSLSSPPVIS